MLAFSEALVLLTPKQGRAIQIYSHDFSDLSICLPIINPALIQANSKINIKWFNVSPHYGCVKQSIMHNNLTLCLFCFEVSFPGQSSSSRGERYRGRSEAA